MADRVTAVDALAEALRRDALGDVRPLWADADHSTRSMWLRRARKVTEVMERCGFVISRRGAVPDVAAERAECAKLVGWLGRKARVEGIKITTKDVMAAIIEGQRAPAGVEAEP